MAVSDLVQESQKVLSEMLQNLVLTINVLTRDAHKGRRLTIWRTGWCSVQLILGLRHAFSFMAQNGCACY